MSTWDDWSAGHVYTCHEDRTTLIGATARELRHLINEHLRTHHASRAEKAPVPTSLAGASLREDGGAAGNRDLTPATFAASSGSPPA